jgi:hypothetical protein
MRTLVVDRDVWDVLQIVGTLLLTAALVGVTIYYAHQAKKQREETEKQRKATEKQVQLLTRHPSEDAARRAVAALRDSGFAGPYPKPDVTTEDSVALWRALDAEAALVTDTELRDRLVTAGLVGFTISFGDLEEDRGLAYSVAWRLMRQARMSGEAYLRGDPLPAWNELPAPTNAQAWLIDETNAHRSKGSSDTAPVGDTDPTRPQG